jgi:two-component system NarL family sensor kinase
VRRDPRIRPLPLLLEHGAASGGTVPIRGRDRPWGVLGAYSRTVGGFTREDANVLRVFANTLAVALERDADEQELRRRSAEITRLATERQRIVAEALDAEDRTRERISQQLHDELLQSLFVVRQDLAKAIQAGDRPELVARAHEGVREAIDLLRAAVFDLHPVVLREGGLRAAVEAVAEHHARLGGFKVTVAVSRNVESEHDRLLLSLARELLANVDRHAGARSAAVTLTRRNRELVLEVTDDGRGMDPSRVADAAARGHIGLASAAQRIEALGGRFEIQSRPGHGMSVRTIVPISPG